MSTGYKIVDQGALHYVTFQIVNWVDLFTRQVYRDICLLKNYRLCEQCDSFKFGKQELSISF